MPLAGSQGFPSGRHPRGRLRSGFIAARISFAVAAACFSARCAQRDRGAIAYRGRVVRLAGGSVVFSRTPTLASPLGALGLQVGSKRELSLSFFVTKETNNPLSLSSSLFCFVYASSSGKTNFLPLFVLRVPSLSLCNATLSKSVDNGLVLHLFAFFKMNIKHAVFKQTLIYSIIFNFLVQRSNKDMTSSVLNKF